MIQHAGEGDQPFAAAAENPFTVHTMEVDPRSLYLLRVNARYMKYETYARLVANIKKDGTLTQYPFVWALRDDTDPDHPLIDRDGQRLDPNDPNVDLEYEVLSGNHRVKASIDAELPKITVIYTEDYLTPDQRKSIQLSHNAISGEDDPAILKTIYESIEGMDYKMYTGLDDKTLELLDDVSIASLSEANLELQTVSMVFLPDELEDLKKTWEVVKRMSAGAKTYWLVSMREYDQTMDALEQSGMAQGVTNVATALRLILRVFMDNIDTLHSVYLTEDYEPIDPNRDVPVETVIGYQGVKAKDASALKRALQYMLDRNLVDSEHPERIIGHLARYFLDAESGKGV